MQIRTLLSLPYIPIYSYAKSSSRQEVIHKAYFLEIVSRDPKAVFSAFEDIIAALRCV